MNIQLKRGLLEFCVLAVLKKGESYGYQIVKDVSQVIEMSESTLYPILKRLEGGNYVGSHSVAYNGRLRKYYQITPAGEAYMADFLKDWNQVMDVYHFIKGAVENE